MLGGRLLCSAVLCAAIVWISLAAAAQTGDTHYLIDSWDGDDGLPSSSVTSIAQTPEGYLWIATFNGLARFDGVRFVTFDPLNTPELKHARVFRLFVDPDGTLWINTYDGSLTSWRNGRFKHEWQGWSGLEWVRSFTRSNELVFVSVSGELLWRTGGAGAGDWHRAKPPQRTSGHSYATDREGVLWFVTREGVLARWAGTNTELAAVETGLRINCIAEHPAGTVWVGTDRGIWSWNGEQLENRTPAGAVPDVGLLFFNRDGSGWTMAGDEVRRFSSAGWNETIPAWGKLFGSHMPAISVSEDRSGSTWFSHYGQGVFKAGPAGKDPIQIRAGDGLPGNRVACWFEDREGNIWLGVDRGGLVRLREKRFQTIGAAEGLSTAGVMSLCADERGALWFGTYGGGLVRWQNGELSKLSSPTNMMRDTATRDFFFSIYPDGARLWLSAGREDLYLLENGAFTAPEYDVHGIKATLVDAQGRVWFGKKAGLSRLSNGVIESFGQRSGFDHTVGIHALAEDARGDIWAGAANSVLYQYREGRFAAHKAVDAHSGHSIWSLLADDDGSIWAGTFRGGLLRFKDGKFSRFTTRDGLPSDVICQILDDGQGKLWLGSHKGIFNISKAALRDFRHGSGTLLPCVAYGLYDGLPTLECSGAYQPSGWRSRDGRLWFATFKGAVSVKPDELRENLDPPPVVMEEVQLNGEQVDLLALQSDRKSVLRIPPGRHYLEFRYTALSYVAPDKIRFRYRLEGLESEWTEVGGRREAYFTHLPPGDYVFRVSACKNEGVWNELGVALPIKILPHFYETRWFQFLTGLLLVGGLSLSVRHFVVRRMRREMERLERQRAVERDRARIAQDIHDDLGAGLTRIGLESEMACREQPEKARARLGQIADMAHGLTHRIDEIVWAVDPQRDTLSGFMDYAAAYAEDFLRPAGLRCRFDVPSPMPALHVEAETRYNLFLGLKEALNNVVKHASATEVLIGLIPGKNGFTLVLEDNGRGLHENGLSDAHRVIGGHGIGNLEKRLQAVGGRCVIHSPEGRGTRIEMSVRAESMKSAFMAMGGNGEAGENQPT